MVKNGKRNTRIRIGERDEHVLEHINLHTISTKEALRKLPCFDGASKDSVATLYRRLTDGGYIDSESLYGQRRYMFLTKRGLDAIAAKHRKESGEPLSMGPLSSGAFKRPPMGAFAQPPTPQAFLFAPGPYASHLRDLV